MRMLDTVDMMFAALGRPLRPSDADLKDLALSREDYAVLSNSPKGARRRMLHMAERFGVSEGQLAHSRGVDLDIARTCANCAVARSCERFRTGRPTYLEPADCPNAPVFSDFAVACRLRC